MHTDYRPERNIKKLSHFKDSHITKEDFVIIIAQRFQTQKSNKVNTILRLQQLIDKEKYKILLFLFEISNRINKKYLMNKVNTI